MLALFWLCFVPLFVAVDALGTLPLFLGLTDGLAPVERRRVVRQSVLTAALLTLAFLIGGPWLLGMLGITTADFMIAGGILLFGLSFTDLLTSAKPQRATDPECVGAVPIGTPLIAGPAVLTTGLLLGQTHGILPTALAALANILIAGAVFQNAERLLPFLGRAGAKTVAKIASLLLAAIAVMMVRKGLAGWLG